jgi:hypothetical protein
MFFKDATSTAKSETKGSANTHSLMLCEVSRRVST